MQCTCRQSHGGNCGGNNSHRNEHRHMHRFRRHASQNHQRRPDARSQYLQKQQKHLHVLRLRPVKDKRTAGMRGATTTESYGCTANPTILQLRPTCFRHQNRIGRKPILLYPNRVLPLGQGSVPSQIRTVHHYDTMIRVAPARTILRTAPSAYRTDSST